MFAESTVTFEIGPGLVAVALALIAVIKTFVTGRQNAKQAEQIRLQVATYIREMRPNGGASLRDAIDRIEQHTAATQMVVAPLAISTLIGQQVTQPATSPTPVPANITTPEAVPLTDVQKEPT